MRELFKRIRNKVRAKAQLFFKWGIVFEDAYSISEKAERKVLYADSREVEAAVLERFPPEPIPVDFMRKSEDMGAEGELSKKHKPKTQKNIA